MNCFAVRRSERRKPICHSRPVSCTAAADSRCCAGAAWRLCAAGAAILLLLLTLILWQLVVKPGGVGVAQARLIIVPGLLLLHYYAHLVQTLALGLSLGILCGGLPLAKSDATMLAICLYVTGTALPVAAGMMVYVAGRGMLLEGDEAGLLLVECGAALVVVAARELGVRLAWRGLGVRFGGERLG